MPNSIILKRRGAGDVFRVVVEHVGGDTLGFQMGLNTFPDPRDPDKVVLSESANPQDDGRGYRFDWAEVDRLNSDPVISAAEMADRNAFIAMLNDKYFFKT